MEIVICQVLVIGVKRYRLYIFLCPRHEMAWVYNVIPFHPSVIRDSISANYFLQTQQTQNFSNEIRFIDMSQEYAGKVRVFFWSNMPHGLRKILIIFGARSLSPS